jgi:hypothetical protein
MFLGKLVGDQGTDHRFTSVASWLQQGGCPSIENGSLDCLYRTLVEH